MSFRSGTIACLALVLTALGGPASASAGHHPAPAPARMLVFAQEWSLWPSRTTVPSGAVSVQLQNRGQDAHDLRIQRLAHGGRLIGRAAGVTTTASGALSRGSWRLRPGPYLLFCSLPGHRARGMHTVIVVR